MGFFLRKGNLAVSPADAVFVSVQVGAAVVSGLRQGKVSMTRRKES